MKLKVFRRTASPSEFFVVGESAVESPATNATSTFTTRISVQPGDILGLAQISGTLNCFFNQTDSSFRVGLNPDPAVGTTLTGATGISGDNRLNISATVESDFDGDGFGDDTQDLCSTDATTQASCPPKPPTPDQQPPTVTLGGSASQNVAKQKVVIVTAGSSESGTLTGLGTISVPGAAKAFALAASSTNVAANVETKLKLKLSTKALKAVKRSLWHHKKVRANVIVTAKDVAGNTSAAAKLTIKVKPKKSKLRR